MLVRADGAVVFANAAMQATAQRGDGIAIKKGLVEFATAEARSRFAAAMAGVARLRERSGQIGAVADFFVPPCFRPADLLAGIPAAPLLPGRRQGGRGFDRVRALSGEPQRHGAAHAARG